MGRLDGKIALITGTAGGQGRSAAVLFATEGAKVIGCDLKTDDNRETRDLVEAAGGEMVDVSPVDLGDPAAAKELVDSAASHWGGLDIIYNNASAQRFAPFAEITLEDWHYTMRNDLNLVFYVTHAAWPHLLSRGGGSIINTSSGAGLRAGRETPTTMHATAKAGVMGFTRALAAEGAAHGIRVNSIAPGLVRTPVLDLHLTPEYVERSSKAIPMGRIGEGEDIAYLAVYLASDESSWVTAQTFPVDGGSGLIS
jgi:meso-butanediol dehydrogenase/(S,S)-butanediol dehydrogenase/diacetyl reductase